MSEGKGGASKLALKRKGGEGGEERGKVGEREVRNKGGERGEGRNGGREE